MKIVRGFKEAEALLSRKVISGDYTISPAFKSKLMEMYGTAEPEQVVRQIISDVRAGGDKALLEYTLKIDNIKLQEIEVSRREINEARYKIDRNLYKALETAAAQIRAFHTAQKDALFGGIENMGKGTIARPLERVGVYAPGGTASYPSTVLMTAIPARVAGVKQVILSTPPRKDGKVPEVTLAAAYIAEVDHVFCMGGAQAIAALAYGTESVPGVDKICGPGNIFVMLAKKQVYGTVDIDGLQGPSEVLIIADIKAKAKLLAAEILAQAEHDMLASSILITDSPSLAAAIEREVEVQLQELNRYKIASESLVNNGIIIIVDSMEEAIELSNLYAPEHLCLDMVNSEVYLDKITNAGCVFYGYAPTVAMGDYVAGPSHALPTSGTARFASPLNISDFIKYTNMVKITREELEKYGPVAMTIAEAEGLQAHSKTVEMRLSDS
ncbi:MAG: histidinol dehydrogenase [Dehalococcoidales bacterium]|nr:histidinol dehydrogenase [Dehalococcoidales bacterium]